MTNEATPSIGLKLLPSDLQPHFEKKGNNGNRSQRVDPE